MKKDFSFLLAFLLLSKIAFSQNVSINETGSNANPSAMLDVSSSTKGILIPRLSTESRNSISNPATGLTVYDTDLNNFYYYNGTSWIYLLNQKTGWNLLGNSGTSAGTNFIGTTDAVDFVAKTNNIERLRISSSGNIGIGISSPNAPLQFANVVANRKVVLFESINNDHQFLGFGINGSILRYQVDQASANHVFYAGSGANSSNELFRIQGNGNVGIGISTPNAPLQFATTTANRKIVLFENENNDHEFLGFGMNPYVLRYQVSSAFANHVFYAANGASSSNELFRIQGNGNVGIGNATPNAPLQFATNAANRKIVLYENANNDHEFLGFGINNSILRYQVSSTFANHVFYAANGASSSNELMRIQGNGNVGIGIDAPTAKLEVNGSVKITDGNQGVGKVLTSDATGLATWQTPYVGGTLSGGTINYIPKWSASNLLSSTSMLFDNGGAVGVGTNNPGATLDVAGTLRVGSDVWHTSSDGKLRNYYETNGNSFFATGNGYNFLNSTYSNVLTILNNGNVGVGTASPNAKLEVAGTLRVGNDVAHTTTDGLFRTFYASNGGTFFGTGNGYSFDNSAYYKIVTFKDNGNVGIGTETPAAKLEVAGSLRLGTNTWHTSSDGKNRTYYTDNGASFYGSPLGHYFGNSLGNTVFGIEENGSTMLTSNVYHYSTDGQIRTQYSTNDATFHYSPNGHYFGDGTGLGSLFSIRNDGSVNFKSDVFHRSSDGLARIYFQTEGGSYYEANYGHYFRNSSSQNLMSIINDGTIYYNNDRNQFTYDGVFRNYYASNSHSFYGTAGGHYFNGPNSYYQLGINDNGALSFRPHVWHVSMDGKNRLFFATDGTTYFGTGAGYIFRNSADNLDILTLASNGNVGIGGCGSPQQALSVNGNIWATGVILGSQAACSDVRFKKDFVQLENSLSKIVKLSGYYYHFKTEEFADRQFSKEKQLGMKAQEVEALFPELVFTDSTGFKYLDYSRLTPVLVEAVKEQQTMIEELKKGNSELKAKNLEQEKVNNDIKEELLKENALLKSQIESLNDLKAEVENLKTLMLNAPKSEVANKQK